MKVVKSKLSSNSFDKIFDIDIGLSEKNNFTKYILIGLLIFGILSILITIFLHYNGKEEELE